MIFLFVNFTTTQIDNINIMYNIYLSDSKMYVIKINKFA